MNTESDEFDARLATVPMVELHDHPREELRAVRTRVRHFVLPKEREVLKVVFLFQCLQAFETLTARMLRAAFMARPSG